MPLNQNDLHEIFSNEIEAVKFCFNHNLIDQNRICGNHEKPAQMFLSSNSNFKCSLCYQCPLCNKKESIFKNSIFTRSKLPIGVILKIIYYWVYEYSCSSTMKECNLSDHTVTNFFQTLQDMCEDFNNNFFTDKIGGPNMNVQIDETLMSKRKYNKGRLLSDVWIFGGICQETNEVFATIVKDRSQNTLMPLIHKYIKEFSIIHSDNWKSYIHINELPTIYQHYTVVHNENFVDPITGSNTQKCERMWRELKKIKKRYEGIPRHRINSHLQEFIFRHNTNLKDKDDPYLFILDIVGQWNFL